MSRATELADRISQNIVTGHDWPNTNDELLKLDSAAELRRLDRVNAELVKALRDAATSLDTIAQLAGRKSYGSPPIETCMEHHDEVRSYAKARSGVAFDVYATLTSSGAHL